MGRQPGDGRGRNNGGRTAGTPNKKDSVTKALLRCFTEAYLTAEIDERDSDGNPTGNKTTAFLQDFQNLDARERLEIISKLMPYHQARLTSTNVDLSVDSVSDSLIDRLADLSDTQTS